MPLAVVTASEEVIAHRKEILKFFLKGMALGLLLGLCIFGLLGAWASYRSAETFSRLQETLPVKTVPITAKAAASQPIVQGDGTAPDEDLKQSLNVKALIPAPLDGLIDAAQKPIVRAADGMSPFEAYKKPFATQGSKKQAAIVLVDFGLSETISRKILDETPSNVTLALSPYAKEPSKWAAAARAYGHELWLMLPVETETFGEDDSGPDTILKDGSSEENTQKLNSFLGIAPGYAGLVLQRNHILTPDSKPSVLIYGEAASRGLALVDTTPGADVFDLVKEKSAQKTLTTTADIWLDETDTDMWMETIEDTLKDAHHAVIFAHPYPSLVEALGKSPLDNSEPEIEFTPLSALAKL